MQRLYTVLPKGMKRKSDTLRNGRLQKDYAKKCPQLIYERNVIMDRLYSEGGIQEKAHGYDLRRPVRVKKFNQAKFVDPDGVRATVHVETRSTLQWEWKYQWNDTVLTSIFRRPLSAMAM